MPTRSVPHPEGLRVLADGTWTVGGAPVVHGAALQYLKARLVLPEEGDAFLADGERRLPVRLDGPPFSVLRLEVDAGAGLVRVGLDDGSTELLRDGALFLDEPRGRVLCRVRGGRADALLTRGAHQTLLAHVEEDESGRSFLRAGLVHYTIRTA